MIVYLLFLPIIQLFLLKAIQYLMYILLFVYVQRLSQQILRGLEVCYSGINFVANKNVACRLRKLKVQILFQYSLSKQLRRGNLTKVVWKLRLLRHPYSVDIRIKFPLFISYVFFNRYLRNVYFKKRIVFSNCDYNEQT